METLLDNFPLRSIFLRITPPLQIARGWASQYLFFIKKNYVHKTCACVWSPRKKYYVRHMCLLHILLIHFSRIFCLSLYLHMKIIIVNRKQNTCLKETFDSPDDAWWFIKDKTLILFLLQVHEEITGKSELFFREKSFCAQHFLYEKNCEYKHGTCRYYFRWKLDFFPSSRSSIR